MKLQESPLLNVEETSLYASLVGGLLYASVWTRPDIAHAVGELTRFIAKPRLVHMQACIRVMRYLKGCTQLGLVYGGRDIHMVTHPTTEKKVNHSYTRDDSSKKEEMKTAIQETNKVILGPIFADANWAGDLENRRSTTGIIVKMNGDLVLWRSTRQKSIATSSTEAEYVSLGAAAKEVMWLRKLLAELGWMQDAATKIFGDNQASIIIAKNDIQHNRIKHIDIQHHFIREQVKDKKIELIWIPTQQQQADILTKGLGRNLFNAMRDFIMNQKK